MPEGDGGNAADAGGQAGDEAAPLLELTWARVCAEERELLRQKRAARAPGRGKPFSVAFSGGGVRAAAFQSGVLWRLAQEGRLGDVEYLAAVSGGGYIASSFASHLLAAEKPQAGAAVGDKGSEDGWYLPVVAKAICRMQRNAGNFVRDPWSGQPGDGSDNLPRWLDVPLLLAVLLVTMASNPLQLLIVYLVPIVEAVHLFFGAAMRAAFCAPPVTSVLTIMWIWSPFPLLATLLVYLVFATFVVFLLGAVPFFQLGGDGKRPSRTSGFIFQKSCLGCLVRVTFSLALLLIILVCVPHMARWEYTVPPPPGSDRPLKDQICEAYARSERQSAGPMSCANVYVGQSGPWYEVPSFVPPAEPVAGGALDAERWLATTVARSVRSGRTVLSAFLSCFVSLLFVAALLVPLVPQVFLTALTFLGPATALVVTACLVKYRVYGPMTGEPFLFDVFPFDSERWYFFSVCCLLALFVVLPFYNDVQRVFHWYYLRSLQVNFFDEGRDRYLPETGDLPQCPLLIVTGTVSDYRPPGAELDISEISFSALHTGSETTGYVRTPSYRSLAKCTALTGAGCLDAISLSMSTNVVFRFWLEVLNLSWGDYIFFRSEPLERARRLVEAARLPAPMQERMTICFYRFPVIVVVLASYSVLTVGWHLKTSQQGCLAAKGLVSTAILAWCVLVTLSFFSFLPRLEFLTCSPILRQIQQATGFCFRGLQPPRTLYVTDGGVRDCTAVVQLLRRRCERILLVLAASDPSDQLGVLRTAMNVATEDKLCSFYDVEDPRRDVRILMEEYAVDLSRSSMTLGVRYGWRGGQPAGLGQICIVKNRLPSGVDVGAPAPLTEEEIRGEPAARAAAAAGAGDPEGGGASLEGHLRAPDLGGLCCCDCAHRKGCNCGRKFPHLTGANYLWLTPRLFAGLCRLGHHISAEAVEAVQK